MFEVDTKPLHERQAAFMEKVLVHPANAAGDLEKAIKQQTGDLSFTFAMLTTVLGSDLVQEYLGILRDTLDQDIQKIVEVSAALKNKSAPKGW